VASLPSLGDMEVSGILIGYGSTGLSPVSSRKLYIAAYDISSQVRLRKALKILKGYACGRQKSVFECYLTQTEYWKLIREMRALLDLEEDRFLLVRHEPALQARVLGKAVAPSDPGWFYVG